MLAEFTATTVLTRPQKGWVGEQGVDFVAKSTTFLCNGKLGPNCSSRSQ